MELHLIRHGRPERVTGETESGTESGTELGADPRLVDSGVVQAEGLAQWYAAHPAARPGVVHTSPMRRAHETAVPLAEACGVPLLVDPRLAELDQGAREYVPMELADPRVWAELRVAFRTGRVGAHVFDPVAFLARIGSALEDLVADQTHERVAVVCHGGVINAWLCTVLDLDPTLFARVRYTSVTRVVAEHGTLRVESINELPHQDLVPPDVW